MVFNLRHRHDIALDEQSARLRWRALNPPRRMACYPLPGRSALQIHSPADPDLVQIEQMEIFFKIFIDGQRAIYDYKQKEKLSGKQSSGNETTFENWTLSRDTGAQQQYVLARDAAGSDQQSSGGSEGGCGEAESPDGDQGSDGGEGGKD